jgi:hypothetical protein
MMGEAGGNTETETVWVKFQELHEADVEASKEHLARIETRLESKVMVLPTFNTAFLPNFTNNERESNQLHDTSSFMTPSNTNIFLQTKFGDKPPWSVRELNNTFSPDPSSLNVALDSWGVGGSVFDEITFNSMSPEYTTEYSLWEVPLSSTDTEYVPFRNPNNDTERERLEADLVVVEEKEEEVGK